MLEQGKAVPSLEKRPDLFPHLVDIWHAFVEVDKSRAYGGFGFPQALTFAEINAYADLSGFFGEDRLELVRYIRALDTIYLKLQADKRAREAKKNRARSKRRN